MFHLRAPIVVTQHQPRRVAPAVRVGELYSVNKQIQGSLIWLGYDLGPAGADGDIGSKSKAAIIAFKKSKGLSPADATITTELVAALAAAVAAKPAPGEPVAKDTYHPPTSTPDSGSSASAGMSPTGIIIAVLAVAAVGVGIYAFAT